MEEKEECRSRRRGGQAGGETTPTAVPKRDTKLRKRSRTTGRGRAGGGAGGGGGRMWEEEKEKQG